MNKMQSDSTDQYDDIIDLPHHVSPTRPRMAMIDRAAQFAPFAALTGYDRAIAESARLTDRFYELSDSDKSQLDAIIVLLQQRVNEHPALLVEFFKPDKRKAGGAYITLSASLKAIDTVNRTISLTDGTVIPFDTIARIQLL